MPHGPGKYDLACEMAREMTDAVGTLLIVIEGNRGNGFSMTVTDATLLASVPALLRMVASQIEADMAPEGHA